MSIGNRLTVLNPAGAYLPLHAHNQEEYRGAHEGDVKRPSYLSSLILSVNKGIGEQISPHLVQPCAISCQFGGATLPALYQQSTRGAYIQRIGGRGE